jgi:hypothetical protein
MPSRMIVNWNIAYEPGRGKFGTAHLFLIKEIKRLFRINLQSDF